MQAGGDAHLANLGRTPTEPAALSSTPTISTRQPSAWGMGSEAPGREPGDRRRPFLGRLRSNSGGWPRTQYMPTAPRCRTTPTSRPADIWYAYHRRGHIQGRKAYPKRKCASAWNVLDQGPQPGPVCRLLAKLTTTDSGHLRIKSQPPLLWPLDEVPTEYGADEVQEKSREVFRLLPQPPTTTSRLCCHAELVDVGLKVVGVGSVGTRCFIVRGRRDSRITVPAGQGGRTLGSGGPSAAQHLRAPGTPGGGGQRMIQAQTDIFSAGRPATTTGTSTFGRLRDWKDRPTGSRERTSSSGSTRICGAQTMARARPVR